TLARRRRGAPAPGVLGHPVGLRARGPGRTPDGDDRQSGASQDEIRHLRRHGVVRRPREFGPRRRHLPAHGRHGRRARPASGLEYPLANGGFGRMIRFRFRPVLVDALKHYRRADLVADVSAGITVGFVALPLAMAFGIASGVKPEQGHVTAIIGGFLISLLVGSRAQVGGPSVAFVDVLYPLAARY